MNDISYKDWRKGRLGASMVPAIMGMDPWRTPMDAALAVLDRVEDDAAGDAAVMGQYLERGVLQWGADRIGATIRTTNAWRVGDAWDGTAAAKKVNATLDAIVQIDGEDIILEAKTSGLGSPMGASDDWGADGTDEVPDRVIIQTHMQMICSGIKLAYVPALLGGRGMVLYRIEYDADIAEAVRTAVVGFFEILGRGELPSGAVSPAVVGRIKRAPGSAIVADEAMNHAIMRWDQCRALRLQAEKDEAAAKSAALTMLGENERALLLNGMVLDYAASSRRSLDQKSLRDAHPDIAEQFTKTSATRTARIRNARKGEEDAIREQGAGDGRNQEGAVA